MSCWLIFHRFVILCAASQRRHLVSSVPTLSPLFAFQLIHVLLLFTCTSAIIMRLHEHNTHTIIYVCLWMYEFNIYSVYACVCMKTQYSHIYLCLLVNVCVSMSVCVSMCWCVCVLILLCYHSHHIHPILFALARFCVLCLLMRPILQQHKCQTHVQKMTDFVMAFWHKIDLRLE